MLRPIQNSVPSLVRVKDGALDLIGLYLNRNHHRTVAVLISKGLVPSLPGRVASSLKTPDVHAIAWMEVAENEIEAAARLFTELTRAYETCCGRTA